MKHKGKKIFAIFLFISLLFLVFNQLFFQCFHTQVDCFLKSIAYFTCMKIIIRNQHRNAGFFILRSFWFNYL